MQGTVQGPPRAACGVLAGGLALAVFLAMSACVGPNFVPPATSAVDGSLPGKLASPDTERAEGAQERKSSS